MAVEMKTLTIGETTYEVVDEKARTNKLSLPVDSSGSVQFGSANQFAVSDGKGGITWLTVANGNEVAY